MTLPISPSQTIGPFSHEAWRWACAASDAVAAGPNTISITGIIRDGAGEADRRRHDRSLVAQPAPKPKRRRRCPAFAARRAT